MEAKADTNLCAALTETHMPPARGDRKRCTHAECSGTMQFGREPRLQAHSAMTGDGERGWVCRENPRHFQRAPERAEPKAAASTATQASWDDDGGAVVFSSVDARRK
jgi:hypothetical protein